MKLAITLLHMLLALTGQAYVAEPQSDVAAECISAITYLALDAKVVGRYDNGVASLGAYERISPDERFILRFYSGAMLDQVALIELPLLAHGSIKAQRTPFPTRLFRFKAAGDTWWTSTANTTALPMHCV